MKNEKDNDGDGEISFDDILGEMAASKRPNETTTRDLVCGSHRLLCYDEEFYEYDDGVFAKLPEPTIHGYIEAEAGTKKTTAALLRNVTTLLRSKLYKDRDKVNQHCGVMNLNNGLLDVAKRELMPHTPEHLSTIRIPITYDPDAACPIWHRCLADWQLDTDAILVLQEFLGYCLVPGNQHKKALVLPGESNTGKSMVLYVIGRLVGVQNTSSLNLGDLDDHTALIDLKDRLVNLCSESDSRRTNEERFKAMVGGVDMVRASRKYKDSVQFTPTAKWVVATNNDMFGFIDKSAGMLNRLIMLPFTRAFADHEQDKALADKLTLELSGILNWALVGLERLAAQGAFTACEASERLIRDAAYESNNVLQYVVEGIVAEKDTNTLKDEIYQDYALFCARTGTRPYRRVAFFKDFYKRLKSEMPDAEIKQDVRLRDDSARPHAVGGIALLSRKAAIEHAKVVAAKAAHRLRTGTCG